MKPSHIDLEDWARCQPTAQVPEAETYRMRLWDGDGFDEKRDITDPKPTGRQILELFNRVPADEYVLLYLPRHGKLESIDLGDTLDLRDRGPERFFAFKTDRLLNFVTNGQRYAWGSSTISAELIRLVARIPEEDRLFLERSDTPDKELRNGDVVQLGGSELERMVSRKQSWELKVQDVVLTLTSPLVIVKDAMEEAGFKPGDGWIINLRRTDEPEIQVKLTDQIDLRQPGIEKLRLTPDQINNGESYPAPRREFRLLEKDETYLNDSDFKWESFVEGGRRWLLIRDYKLPDGYNHPLVDIAIDVPPTYPRAEIDMFYCHPHLELKSGRIIGETSVQEQIGGMAFQRWSRHLNGVTKWNPNTDSVMTHLAVVESALLKEIKE